MAGLERRSRVLRPRGAERSSRTTRPATRSSRRSCRTPIRCTRSRSSRARSARSASRCSSPPRTASLAEQAPSSMDRLAVMLGGRAAEELVFGDVTTGAHDDIERATQIARHMVCQFGMSERLGPLSYGRRESLFLGDGMLGRRRPRARRPPRRSTPRSRACSCRRTQDQAAPLRAKTRSCRPRADARGRGNARGRQAHRSARRREADRCAATR